MLWAALWREPRRLAALAVWSVLEALPAFLIGHAVARAIEDGFAAGRPGTGLGWLAVLGAAWVVAALAARQVVLAVAAIAEPFRDDLLTRVVGGAVRGTGDASAVARSGLQVELARDAFAAVVTTVRGFAFGAGGVLLGMLTLAPGTLLLVLPPFTAGLILFLLSLPLLARRQRDFLTADEELTAAMSATAGGLRDIVACGDEDREGERLAARVAAQAGAARALARVTAVRTAALGVGGWLPVVLVLAGTPWLASTGAGAGVILGTLAYITQSLAPALNGLVQGLGVSGVRLAATLSRITAAAPLALPPAPRVPPADAAVELRQVTFAYGPHSEPVVDRLDLCVPDGDHLAVVGPSGAGKSTLAALIAGVLRPGSGRVTVGGVPAHEADPSARVLIPQEAYVFRGTLRENLAYLRSGAPDETPEPADPENPGSLRSDGDVEPADRAGFGSWRSDGDAEPADRESVGSLRSDGDVELVEAVAALGAERVVERVGGYGAVVEPKTLSAGERQLVALVRAYLSPARLIILDEASCHLDPAAEARVEAAFARRDGTLVVVAHRLTSALRARRVLLMDGSATAEGNHEELIRLSPLYADLAGHWEPETLERTHP